MRRGKVKRPCKSNAMAGAVCNPRSCKTRARPAVERKNAGVILARAKCRWMRKLFESSKQRDNRELFAIDGANFGGDMSKRSLSSDARKQRRQNSTSVLEKFDV